MTAHSADFYAVRQVARSLDLHHTDQTQALAALASHASGAGGQVTPWQAAAVVALVTQLTTDLRRLVGVTGDPVHIEPANEEAA